ncbi:cache domain-containing sensor histidine kinase [Cohnella lubricantis]|uniref:histidine kinase n=1 Tax=Cohnella lubricantis TaxID=2163172 RepID=A0A841THB5_9BACL|nr:sensor histidine kinase [Cohnella lubricantis]MBB6679796.1 sensor histidine kinase [Cohnella lubricantis]
MKHYRFKSIQFLIAVSFTAMTIAVVLAVSYILYDKFTRTAEKNTSQSNEQTIYQVAKNLEYYIRSMTIFFAQVENTVKEGGDYAGERMAGELDTIFRTREDLVTIALFDRSGHELTALPSVPMRSNTNLTSQSWFRSAVENPNHLSFSLPHVQNLFQGQYKWVVSMSKGIKLQVNGEEQDAVLLVDVNFKLIDDLTSSVKLGQKGYAYIIDESAGNIIYHPQQQLIYAGIKYENVEQALKYTYGSYIDNSTGVERLITIQTVSNVGWKIVGVSFMDEIGATKREIGSFLLWLLAAVLLFVLAITLYMSAKISQPIKRLEKSMQLVERGNFNITIPIRRDDEVGRLSRRFNLMVNRIRELMGQIIAQQESKRRSELEVLQSQIHPHFLYNTLNSVVRLAGTGKNDEVITMITSLSKFFRISLSKGKPIIPLADELEHIRNYLIIQKLRYKNKFEFEIFSSEGLEGLQSPKLILQPIVENAIYHGIEPSVDAGRIVIRAELADGKLRLQVADNGVGMSAEKAARLLLETSSLGEGEQAGIGLRNVHERICLYFGTEYGLHIESEQEEGTTVTIWLPCVKEDDPHVS